VLANGEEGEPAGWKDRFLMRRHPHLIVEGVAVAAFAVGAEHAWVYLADSVSAAAITNAVDAAADLLAGLTVQVVQVDHTYVAGEETAAIRFIDGGPALPTAKPPRPFEAGIQGAPTLVDNVETLAHAAWIAANGARRFRETGTPEFPGTFLACVSGDVASPVLTEVPFGVTLQDIIDAACPVEPIAGALLGGYFSGYLPGTLLGTPADDESLRPLGFGLGNGAVVAIGESRCPVQVMGDLAAFFAASSAGQCGPCAKGTAAMGDVLASLRTGHAAADALERLARYGQTLRGRGACQLLDAAALVASRGLLHFSEVLEAHSTNGCATCREAGEPDPTGGFAIDIEEVMK
jgi:NADH:ubiquinone oxidoreductase subunit F (NADH-binding)